MGSGTSLIEAQRLHRNSIGIEIQENVAKEVYERLKIEKNDYSKGQICIGDSNSIDIKTVLEEMNIEKIQFVVLHPPYWNIVKFSDNIEDLSNTNSLDSFLQGFEKVIDNTCCHLEKNRYCAVIIGDKYANSEIVPLGFHCMNLFLKKGYILKGTIIKNFEETKGKSNQKSIWRYRALASDFFIFKHEYIFVFKKVKD